MSKLGRNVSLWENRWKFCLKKGKRCEYELGDFILALMLEIVSTRINGNSTSWYILEIGILYVTLIPESCTDVLCYRYMQIFKSVFGIFDLGFFSILLFLMERVFEMKYNRKIWCMWYMKLRELNLISNGEKSRICSIYLDYFLDPKEIQLFF